VRDSQARRLLVALQCNRTQPHLDGACSKDDLSVPAGAAFCLLHTAPYDDGSSAAGVAVGVVNRKEGHGQGRGVRESSQPADAACVQDAGRGFATVLQLPPKR